MGHQGCRRHGPVLVGSGGSRREGRGCRRLAPQVGGLTHTHTESRSLPSPTDPQPPTTQAPHPGGLPAAASASLLISHPGLPPLSRPESWLCPLSPLPLGLPGPLSALASGLSNRVHLCPVKVGDPAATTGGCLLKVTPRCKPQGREAFLGPGQLTERQVESGGQVPGARYAILG